MNIQVQKGKKYGLDERACQRRKEPMKPVSVSAMGWDGTEECPCASVLSSVMWQPIRTRLTAGSAARAQRMQTQV